MILSSKGSDNPTHRLLIFYIMAKSYHSVLQKVNFIEQSIVGRDKMGLSYTFFQG
jgi:hypothetical protein